MTSQRASLPSRTAEPFGFAVWAERTKTAKEQNLKPDANACKANCRPCASCDATRHAPCRAPTAKASTFHTLPKLPEPSMQSATTGPCEALRLCEPESERALTPPRVNLKHHPPKREPVVLQAWGLLESWTMCLDKKQPGFGRPNVCMPNGSNSVGGQSRSKLQTIGPTGAHHSTTQPTSFAPAMGDWRRGSLLL